MPKGEYTRTEAGRRAYFVVTGIELPKTRLPMMKSKGVRGGYQRHRDNIVTNNTFII